MSHSILLVDDSMVMRKIISRNLRRAGIQIASMQEASNGVEALEQLQNHQFDLIFCDVNMPEMDGLTFLKEFRSVAEYNDIKIVMLTTESGSDYKLEAKNSGANGYLTKPSTPEEIGDVIKSIL